MYPKIYLANDLLHWIGDLIRFWITLMTGIKNTSCMVGLCEGYANDVDGSWIHCWNQGIVFLDNWDFLYIINHVMQTPYLVMFARVQVLVCKGS